LKLHTDPDAFSAILAFVNETANIRLDVLEKDYYVTLLLKELSDRQDELPAYFKGGTALYKALGNVRRFSEDIDLTVHIEGCSNSQAKRRLEKAANGYRSLPRTTEKALESNQRGAITCLYDYRSVFGVAVADPLQRFGHVKVEATSFTVSEPFAPLSVVPLVYEKADEDQNAILRTQYDVLPFFIDTICLERIFVDKVFAAEFYYQRKEYFDVSKHLYDIAVMSELDAIRRLLADPVEMSAMMAFKRREERMRIGSDLSGKPVSDFVIFDGMNGNKALRDAFYSMQNIYVFEETDRLGFDAVSEALLSIKIDLLKEEIRDSDF
jgi:predicted nucleotidyltransferase component of viral defense system